MKEDDRGTGHIPLLAYYGGHEIGLFLGYPSKDVAAFMENSSAGVKYLGMWKVYSDVETAKIKFARYRSVPEHIVRLSAGDIRLTGSWEAVHK